MPQKLTCVQAYKSILHFLGTVYFQTYDEFLSDILSGGALYSAEDGQEPETMDPAIWGDWMDGLKIVMHDDTVRFDTTMLTTQQAYAAVYQYLVVYCNMGAEPSIFTLRDLLGTDIEQSNITKYLWSRWLQTVNFMITKKMFQEKNGIFIGEQTILDEESSFEIMQIFLDNYCQQDYNQSVWNIWQNAIIQTVQEEKSERLNLLIAFHAMIPFMLDHFDNDQVTILKDMILKFAIDKDSKPVDFSFWRNWASAAVKLNAKHMELMNDLISINTPISTEAAFEIIQAWLQYKVDIVGTDVIQQVLVDTQGVQQVIDKIKQQPRSYLLLDNEVTILETYHIMTKLLELHGKAIQEFAVDENGKPVDFEILLDWVRICEQVIKA